MEIEEPSGILSEYMTERRVRKRLKVERTRTGLLLLTTGNARHKAIINRRVEILC